RKSLIIFFVLIFMFFAFKINAQIQSGEITLEINPQYPKENEEVRASLSTFTTDLNKAKISWKLDGQTALEGVGKTNFSFNVGISGSQTNLEIKIETLNGSVVNKQIYLSPSSVDMLWEAYDTYAPPFYKGKTMAPIEGMVKVVAIPSNKNLAGFNYNWRQDNKNKTASSGYEKNYYLYKNSYLEKNNEIEATVSDIFGSDNGSGKITITPGVPKIVFYEKNSSFGTKWEKALSDGFIINPNGTTIVAEPYFFSIKDLNSSNYSFKWFLNGEQTIIPNQKNSLAIKPEGGKSGSSNIKITINNIPTLFQSVSKELNVNF
ncbi:MAG: hypothetical protein AAB493_02730, partial [Patescibacteria group bacterium]